MEIFLGARPYDFKDEETGRQITGVSVFFCDNEQQGATGYVPSKVSMSPEAFKTVFGDNYASMVMKPVAVSYNKRGKPEAVEVIPTK